MESGKTKLASALIAAALLAASCCHPSTQPSSRPRPSASLRRSRAPREQSADEKAILARARKMAQIGDLDLANKGLPKMIGGGGYYIGDDYIIEGPATIAKAGPNLLKVTLYTEKNGRLFSESVLTDPQGNPQSLVTPSRPTTGDFPVCAYTPELTCAP